MKPWARIVKFGGLGLLVGTVVWVAAQSQATSPIGSYLELGGQVTGPAASPTLNSTLDLTGDDQVRWTSYFQSKLDGPQETEGVLDIPPGHTWVAGSVRKPANASMQWLVNEQWTSTEPANGSAVTQVKWTLAPQSRLISSQNSHTGKYLGKVGYAYRLIPYKDSMFMSMMGGLYGGSANSGYLKCRLASSTYDPCVTRVVEMARSATGLPGVYFISSGGYSFPDKEGELLQLADTGPKSRLWHSSIVPLENVNQETGEMFMGMQKADGSGNYVVCLNLDTFRHCGQWRLSTAKEQLINLGSAGSKYFTMVDGSGTVVCFDTAKRAECGRTTLPGAYDLIPTARATQALVVGENMYILSRSTESLHCLKVATTEPCPGWYRPAQPMGIFGHNGSGLYPYLHPDGRPRGVCYGALTCIGLDGSSFTANYQYLGITGQSLNGPFHNADAVVGTKIYLRFSLLLRCFDFATDNQCGMVWTPEANPLFNDPNQPYASAWDTTTTRVDPTRPNCVLIVGASGLAHMFDPTKTGGQLLENNPPKPCDGGGGNSLPELDVNPSQALQCDATRAKVSGWDKVRLSQSVPWGGSSGLSGVKVTLKTPAGTLLPEALKPVRQMPYGSYQLDISDIPYSDYPALKVAVELLSPGSLAANGSAGVDVTWKGDPIQVCVSTQAPPGPDCQTVATLNVKSTLLGSNVSEALTVSKVMSPGGSSSGYAAIATATSARAVLVDKGPRDPKTQVTQGRWSLSDFSGDLWAFGLNEQGQIDGSRYFSAQAGTQAPAQRPLYVATPSGGALPVKPLEWAGLTPSQQAALNTNLSGLTDTQGAARLEYLRGADGPFRPRGGKVLGPVLNSSPAMLLPSATLGLSEKAYPGYTAYRSTVTRAHPMALFGGNDGALHGYEVRPDGLREAWSFVPNVMLPRAANYADASLAGVRANPYFVDNIPMVGHTDVGAGLGWRAVAVMSYGRGARAITALDVTNSNLEQGAGVLFEYSNTTDPALKDLGYIVSQPAINNAFVAQQIVQMATPDGAGRRAAVLVGNGIHSNDGAGGLAHSGTGKPVLYAFYFDRSGAPRWHRWAVDELWPGAASEPGLSVNNGLSTPTPVDVDGDGRVDVVYAGDQQGNLWRFDVRNPDAASITRLFQTDAQQPITQAPFVTANPLAAGCGSAEANATTAAKRCWQVVFGTGAGISPLLGSANVATQSLYGVLDKGRGQTVGLGSLTRIDYALNEVVKSVEYRALTPTQVDYPGGALGWRIDLQAFEHGVGAPRLQTTGLLMFSSIRPVTPDRATNVCIGPRSWLNEVDPLQGYSALVPFDTNADGLIDGQDRLAASSNKPLSPSGMAVSGAQFGPPAVLLASSTQAQQMSLLLPSLGQDTGQVNAWSGGPGQGGSQPTPGSNSAALTHANPARLGRMTWREVY